MASVSHKPRQAPSGRGARPGRWPAGPDRRRRRRGATRAARRRRWRPAGGWPRLQASARAAVEARLIEAGRAPPRAVVEFSTTAAQLVGILRARGHVWLVGESALADEAHRGLAVLPLADARFTRRIGVPTRRDARLSPLAQRFVEILGELPR